MMDLDDIAVGHTYHGAGPGRLVVWIEPDEGTVVYQLADGPLAGVRASCAMSAFRRWAKSDVTEEVAPC